jgi:hypothetical protein
VGSTDLSGRLDPENLREVVRVYQETAAEVMACYEGYIAQYLGDGLLIYFDYPVAHEDDAYRAVHTGLEIPAAIAALNSRSYRTYYPEMGVLQAVMFRVCTFTLCCATLMPSKRGGHHGAHIYALFPLSTCSGHQIYHHTFSLT